MRQNIRRCDAVCETEFLIVVLKKFESSAMEFIFNNLVLFKNSGKTNKKQSLKVTNTLALYSTNRLVCRMSIYNVLCGAPREIKGGKSGKWAGSSKSTNSFPL